MASPGGGDKHSEEWRPVSLVGARSAYLVSHASREKRARGSEHSEEWRLTPTIGRSLWGQTRDTRSSFPGQLISPPEEQNVTYLYAPSDGIIECHSNLLCKCRLLGHSFNPCGDLIMCLLMILTEHMEGEEE
jgi:hypothetical protein